MNILVLGASGMLGNAIVRNLLLSNCHVFGTIRSNHKTHLFSESIRKNLLIWDDVFNFDVLNDIFYAVRPDIVINCIGLIKQLNISNDPLQALPINSLLPHKLYKLTNLVGARFIHFSTDCVFSGKRGNYKELDVADASDLYGRSKLLGEVDQPNAITLRTSLIGHELNTSHSLIDWFLSQSTSVSGYTRAIFSGLPTIEVANILRDFVIPKSNLRGIYHVSADSISKYDLLQLVAKEYKKKINIEFDDSLAIDRSLDSTIFRLATGYQPPPWDVLINEMRQFG